jgi:two-component system, OmpR family, response regulator
MRILIVDDEQKLADSIARGLRLKGYACDVLYDGESALTRISVHAVDYDVIILDLMLPKVSGTQICKTVRELDITVPILILTAKDDIDSKVNLLLSGADDYMVKPFSFEELAARLYAILRRPHESLPDTIRVGHIRINPATRVVHSDDVLISLTLKEYALLEYLARRPNEVIKREEILSNLWDFYYDSFSNVLDVHVKNLRKKIAQEDTANILETVRGVGYRLRA